MKLLASDYDGTLKRPNVSKSDIDAIKRFRASGNLFGIVTGRTLALIIPELKRFGVPYDFVIGVNGAIMVDSKHNLIFKHIIDEAMCQKFVDYALQSDAKFVAKSDGVYIKQILGRHRFISKIWLTLMGLGYKMVAKTTSFSEIASFVVTGRDSQHTLHLCSEIDERFGYYLEYHRNKETIIDISVKNISKYSGVKEAQNYFNVEKVFVIGDSYNDLPMLDGFNGFSVSSAMIEIKERASKVFDDFDQLVEYLLNYE